MKRFFSAVLYIVTGILVFLTSLIGFSAGWAFRSWGDIDMDEIVFHLQQPLQGAGNGVIGDYLLKGLLPCVLVTAVFVVLLILLKKGKARILCSCAFLAAVIISGFLIRNMIWERLDMQNWIDGQINQSDFVEENYVDPKSVSLTFPEKKRNLIYLYLESMETTYADRGSGGAFEENTIPELTEIAVENEDFSGNTDLLNGGIVLPGTAFTTGAIFAQTAGLPLKLSISGNFMDTQESFFPQVTALGDLLEEQGYRQIFLIGSDAVFGGRQLYFTEHGNFEIRDYSYAKEKGWIDPDYEVFWGYEDEKLFRFAQETISELAQGDAPFALTMLTVDTHYEDGYVCRLCREDFPGDQYANVMACSSRQVKEFLSWIREQEFYENTTVIISGDHTTMDTDFCENVDPGYQRKTYTAVINSAVEPEQPEKDRLYSTMDLFPTAAAAMGIRIPGNRLGLGTNLFSSEETLLEQYGTEYVKKELGRRSDFLSELEKIEGSGNEKLMERLRLVFQDSLSAGSYDPERKTAEVKAVNLYFYDDLPDESMGFDISKIEAEYQENGTDTVQTVQLKKSPDEEATYTGTLDLSGWSGEKGQLRLNLYTASGDVYKNVDSLEIDFSESR